MSGVDRDEARWRIEAQVEEILERWREPPLEQQHGRADCG
jgi:hypothetical protein